MPINELTGCEEIRKWLQEQGFTVSPTPAPLDATRANWYAHRACTGPSRARTIHVWPHRLQQNTRQIEIADVSALCQVDGFAFEVKAATMGFADLVERLETTAQRLIAACEQIEAPQPRSGS